MGQGQEGPPTFPRGVWTRTREEGCSTDPSHWPGKSKFSEGRKAAPGNGISSLHLAPAPGYKTQTEDGRQGGCRHPRTVRGQGRERGRATRGGAGLADGTGAPGPSSRLRLFTQRSAASSFALHFLPLPFLQTKYACFFSSRFPIFFSPWTSV